MRLLGIDLGSTSVKAIELDSAFGRYEVHEYHEKPIASGVPDLLEAQVEALDELVASLARKPDRIAIAFKTGITTFRNLNIPSKDKKTIQTTVGFELEDELPFNMDETVFDTAILGSSPPPGQGSHVHVASTLVKMADPLLTRLSNPTSKSSLDPDVATTEAWALRTLLNRMLSPEAQQKPVMVIHFGHLRTIIYVHWRGAPIVCREVRWGGHDLTTAICKKFGIPLDQAAQTKHEHGFMLPESQKEQATPEQVEFSNALLEPYSKIVQEIRGSELIAKNVSEGNLSQIWISGGTSLLPGFAKRLEEDLNVEVRAFQSLTGISQSGVTYSEHSDASFALATGIALTLVGPAKSGRINLRKGALAKLGSETGFSFKKIKGPLTALGAISASLFLSLMIQGYVYGDRLKDTNVQLEKSVRTFFGTLSASALRTTMASTKTLKTKINAELSKQREISKLMTPNPESPLDYLKEISASIPKDVVVDMTQYQLGSKVLDKPYAGDEPKSLSLTFIVASPQVAEKLSAMLTPKVSGLERGKMEEIPASDNMPKRWKFTITGTPAEASYGR